MSQKKEPAQPLENWREKFSEKYCLRKPSGINFTEEVMDYIDRYIITPLLPASQPPEAPIDDCDFCHGTREYEVNVNGADVPVECSFCKEEANQDSTGREVCRHIYEATETELADFLHERGFTAHKDFWEKPEVEIWDKSEDTVYFRYTQKQKPGIDDAVINDDGHIKLGSEPLLYLTRHGVYRFTLPVLNRLIEMGFFIQVLHIRQGVQERDASKADSSNSDGSQISPTKENPTPDTSPAFISASVTGLCDDPNCKLCKGTGEIKMDSPTTCKYTYCYHYKNGSMAAASHREEPYQFPTPDTGETIQNK